MFVWLCFHLFSDNMEIGGGGIYCKLLSVCSATVMRIAYFKLGYNGFPPACLVQILKMLKILEEIIYFCLFQTRIEINLNTNAFY